MVLFSDLLSRGTFEGISFGICSTPINRFLVNIASSNIDALPKWHLPLQNYPAKSSTLALGAFFDKNQISVDGRFNNPQFTKIQDNKQSRRPE